MRQIQQEVIKHFQNCAGSINQDKPIPSEWINEYQPLLNIDENIYASVLNPITEEEWLDVLNNNLPQGKANGPSNISYKDISLSPIEYNQILKDIIEKTFISQQVITD